jgi:hypothetical protein
MLLLIFLFHDLKCEFHDLKCILHDLKCKLHDLKLNLSKHKKTVPILEK